MKISLRRMITKISLLTFLIAAIFVVAHESELFCAKVQASCSTQPVQENSTQLASNYFTYSDEKLQELLNNGKQVVLYFHAPWCTSCSSFDDELKKIENALPEKTAVLQINYDTNRQLRQQYQVVYQHTLVLLDNQGNIKESWIGGDLKALQSYLQKILE